MGDTGNRANAMGKKSSRWICIVNAWGMSKRLPYALEEVTKSGGRNAPRNMIAISLKSHF
jgi:hypothetical protein